MKLYFSPTSPYARKVRMTILEKNLGECVQLIAATPFADDAALKAANPLGKVPALISDDGQRFFDSPVICAYLDEQSSLPKLIPEGSKRWEVLTGAALADGMMDAAFSSVVERRRDKAQQSPDWLDRWSQSIMRSMAFVENNVEVFNGAIDMAQIGLGAALDYIEFRSVVPQWQDSYPKAAAWFEEFSSRPCMQQADPRNA